MKLSLPLFFFLLLIYLDELINPLLSCHKRLSSERTIVQKQVMQKGEIGVCLSSSIPPAFSPHSSSASPASPVSASVFGF